MGEEQAEELVEDELDEEEWGGEQVDELVLGFDAAADPEAELLMLLK